MVAIPQTVPPSLFAGDTAKFHRRFDDYSSASGWTYNIYFNGPANNLTVAGAATADGGFDITIAASATTSFPAGTYRYIERVNNATTGEVYTVGSGALDLLPNIATAAAGATQTHEEKTLAVIEAALYGRLTADMQSYQIAGRAVVKIPIAELRKMRGEYAAIVRMQKGGGAFSRTIEVEFNPTTPEFFPVRNV